MNFIFHHTWLNVGFNSWVSISVKFISVSFLTWSWLKKHYHVVEEKKRCCYLKGTVNVFIGQSTEKHNFIPERFGFFFYLHPASKMITMIVLKYNFFFLLSLFSFLNLSKLFLYGHFHFFLKMVTLFLLKRLLTFNCVEKPLKNGFFPFLLKINKPIKLF